ncbi:hypothetical protein UT300005_08240 [Clostridium sp. CTA-5]
MKKLIKVYLSIFLIIIFFFENNYCIFLNALYNNYNDYSCFKNDIYNTDSYIKNPIVPKHLYVISESDMNKEEQTMISTLQGIISTKSDIQIYILTLNEPDYNIWLNDLNKNYHVKYKRIRSPWKLLNKFKSYIKGYILYNNSKSSSINNACSLAALKDSIVIDESLEYKIKSYGITKLIQDCRDTDKYWAYNNLWNLGLNHSTVIELSPDKSMALRDYAIMSNSLIFYEDDVNDTSLRESIFKSMDNTAHCLGWGPDEHINVSIASKFGVDIIAADWSYNLSTLSAYPCRVENQIFENEFKEEDDVHYITFIASDGDNQQWFLGNNYSSKEWYGSQYRGDFNLGWSISPALYYLAPTVFNQYYQSASSLKYNDYFLVPPSGNGYMYPSKFPINKLDSYTKRLSNYMKKVDQSYVLILDDDAFYKKDLWNKYTCHDNVNGLFYLNYKKHDDYNGKLIWSNSKPVVSCRDLLWNDLEDEDKLVENINNRIDLGYTNIKNPNAYTFVYVHVWSKTMSDLEDVITKLNKNPRVRIVTPDIFIKLIKTNILPIN